MKGLQTDGQVDGKRAVRYDNSPLEKLTNSTNGRLQGILYQEKMQITSLDTLIYQYLMIIYSIMYFLLRNKYFITTKFHQNPSSGSGEDTENVKS